MTALKLSAVVPRILKKEAFISGRFLGLCNSSLFIFNLKTAWEQVKVQFN